MKELLQITKAPAFQKRVLSLVSVWMAALLLVFAMPITVSAAASGTCEIVDRPSTSGSNYLPAKICETVDQLADIMLTDDEKNQIELGEEYHFWVAVNQLYSGDLYFPKEKIDEGEEFIPDKPYLDIDMVKHYGPIDCGHFPSTDLKSEVTIQLTLPDSAFANVAEGKVRVFYVYHNKNGQQGADLEKIDATSDPATKTITFKSKDFSPFAIVYNDVDKPQAPSIPLTENNFVPIIPMPGAPANPAPDADDPMVIVPETDAPTVALPATGSDNTAATLAALLLACSALLLVSRKKTRA